LPLLLHRHLLHRLIWLLSLLTLLLLVRSLVPLLGLPFGLPACS